MQSVAAHFRAIRGEHPTVDAATAHRWAKHERAVDELDAAIEWDWTRYSRVIVGKLGDVEIRVYSDDEVYEWGDIEPTEQERRDLEVIGVGVRIVGDDDELDAIWGCGYLHGDVEREACSVALQYGFIEAASREITERERLDGFVETT